MKNVKQIINEVDIFDADLGNIALSKKKRSEYIIMEMTKEYNQSIDINYIERDLGCILATQASLLIISNEPIVTEDEKKLYDKSVIDTLKYLHKNYKLIKK